MELFTFYNDNIPVKVKYFRCLRSFVTWSSAIIIHSSDSCLEICLHRIESAPKWIRKANKLVRIEE